MCDSEEIETYRVGKLWLVGGGEFVFIVLGSGFEGRGQTIDVAMTVNRLVATTEVGEQQDKIYNMWQWL